MPDSNASHSPCIRAQRAKSHEDVKRALHGVLHFKYVSVDHFRGGREARVLSLQDGGVYFVVCKLFGDSVEMHDACAYDSTGTDRTDPRFVTQGKIVTRFVTQVKIVTRFVTQGNVVIGR